MGTPKAAHGEGLLVLVVGAAHTLTHTMILTFPGILTLIMRETGASKETMGLVQTPVRCRIAGRGAELEPLQKLAHESGAADKVDFLGYVSSEDILALYAGALGVYYAPLDEDYGLATIEAMRSQKPVLTASDSGGVLEFVQDRVTGMVTPPGDPATLAQRIDELYLDRQLAERLGTAGQYRVAHITWDAAIDRLLGF